VTRVIKIGGAVVDDEVMLSTVLDRCAMMDRSFVLVHGGGKIATKLARDLGVEQTMIDGRRVTDADTLRIVTMVYGGLINKNIVTKLQARSVQCIGLTGADANLIRSHQRTHQTIDYGFVGDVDTVNIDALTALLGAGFSILLAPLTHDGNGQLLNTNADTIASKVAIALAVPLLYVFEHHGVLRSVEDPTSVIPVVHVNDIPMLIADGTIVAGMVPKITNAAEAARAGINVLIQHVSALGTEEGTLIKC